MKDKRIINIGGSVRSGTTILNLIIANDEKAMALGEVMSLFYPNRKQHKLLIRELLNDKKWSKIILGGPKNLYTNLFKYFPEIDFFIDSSKNPSWFRKQEKYNPDLNFSTFLIYKHPLDQKSSLLRRDRNINWEKLILNYYSRFITLNHGFISVNLYDLLCNSDTIRRISMEVGMNNHKNKLEYWKRKQPNFRGSDTVGIKRIDTSRISPVSKQDDYAFIKSAKLKETYNVLLDRDILQGENRIQLKANLFSIKWCLFLNAISDFKFRIQLFIRDYIKDRDWLNES